MLVHVYIDCSGSMPQTHPVIDKVIADHPGAAVFGFDKSVWAYSANPRRGGNGTDYKAIVDFAEACGATEAHVVTDWSTLAHCIPADPSIWTIHKV